MGIDNIFEDYDDTDEKLRMQELIRRNKDKMPKLSPSGEAKMREALKDVESGNITEIHLTSEGYCNLYGKFCSEKNTNQETRGRFCSKNLDCGDKEYFISIDSILGDGPLTGA